MRTINVQVVTPKVRAAVQQINFQTPEPTMIKLVEVLDREPSPAGQQAMQDIVENRHMASAGQLPMCPGYRNGSNLCTVGARGASDRRRFAGGHCGGGASGL